MTYDVRSTKGTRHPVLASNLMGVSISVDLLTGDSLLGSTLTFFLGSLVTSVGAAVHWGVFQSSPEMILSVGQGQMSLEESLRQSLTLNEIIPGKVFPLVVGRPR